MLKYSLIFIIVLLAACSSSGKISQQRLDDGKQLAFARSKGNCLACHQIEDGDTPGNIGPPLLAIATRFDNKIQLRRQIWDATEFNPLSSMPPFGKNKIISEREIDLVVDYIWSIQ